MDWHASLGLVLCFVVILIARYLPVHTECTKEKSSTNPAPLANRKPGLVKCGVASPTVANSRRTAQEIAASVVAGKRAIAAHMGTDGLRRCSSSCEIRTTIAGVVRDRKRLKKLKYDQPF